jgi:hypothetical protein
MNNYSDMDGTMNKLEQIFEYLLFNIDILRMKNYTIEYNDVSCRVEK